jgi:nicotinamide-nucleotide amidase
MKNNTKTLEQIIQKLTKNKHTISFAESCTGGQLAAAFTAISGASTVLNGSVVTYSNTVKHQWLNVDKKVLKNHGAVSSECVSQMLGGIKEMSGADYALAISGIAGPTGGSEEKPVGTVYIGLLTPSSSEVFHCLFEGDREAVQKQSTAFAIEKLAKFLEI